MPHSSGGGGGSFGGGGGSFDSGSSGSDSVHYSNNPFPGADQYVYYHHGSPHYFYTDVDPTKKPSPLRFLLLLIYLPFLAALLPMAKGIINIPKKLPIDYNTAIVINDDADVITDEAKLASSLEAFLDKTGIAPAVVTVDNETWQANYADLETYAYDWYVDNFPDENHWLIMYSEPQDPVQGDRYYWEGMQGDNTDNIITTQAAEGFNNNLNNLLAQGDRPDVSGSISKAFDDLTPTLMKVTFRPQILFMGILFFGFIIFHALGMTGVIGSRRKYRNAVQVVKGAKEVQCSACSGKYMSGTVETCPYCGAPVSGVEDIRIRTDADEPVKISQPYMSDDTYDYSSGQKVRAEDIDDSELPLSQRVKGIFKPKDDIE